MQNPRPFAAAALLVAVPAVDSVRLSDTTDAGTARTLTYASELTYRGGSLEVQMGGSPVPAQFLPTLELDSTDRRELVVEDAYDDRGWVRTYDTIAWSNAGEMSMSGMGGDESFPWSADPDTQLEGRKVRFKVDGDGVEAADFADDEGGDREMLEGLAGDLGLSVLLPEDEVEVGADWTIDGALLGDLFEPGGDLGWDLPPEAAENLMPTYTSREHSGELTLILSEVEDGIASCEVAGELIRTSVKPGDLSEVPVADGAATDTVTDTWDVAGELRWNVDAGHLVELKLTGEMVQETVTERDPDLDGPTYESVFSVDGSYTLSVNCAPTE